MKVREGRTRVLLGRQEIEEGVRNVAALISRDYREKCPIFIGTLKGSFIFLSDLIRSVEGFHLEVDFIRVSSYGDSTGPTGEPLIKFDAETRARGRDIILVEDIVDTGKSMDYLISHIRKKSPRTLKVCALIDKRSRREKSVTIDYCCFQVETGFLVGYGLDFSEKYRNIKDILVLEDM